KIPGLVCAAAALVIRSVQASAHAANSCLISSPPRRSLEASLNCSATRDAVRASALVMSATGGKRTLTENRNEPILHGNIRGKYGNRDCIRFGPAHRGALLAGRSVALVSRREHGMGSQKWAVESL